MTRLTTGLFLPATDPELLRAWATFPDPVMLDQRSEERLEYMGTSLTDGRWRHVFRHRCVPATQQRQYWQVAASAGWMPEGVTHG